MTESWEELGAGAGLAWPFLTGGGVAAEVLSLLFEVLQMKKLTSEVPVTCPACLHGDHTSGHNFLSSPGTGAQGGGAVTAPEVFKARWMWHLRLSWGGG